MRFYHPHSQYYCGIDLHSRFMYICIMDKDQRIYVHKKVRNQDTALFLAFLKPYMHDLVVACESSYAWYWLADLCYDNDIEFILGHAFYMKAVHGAKVKNDRIDSQKIALLALSGMFPLGYSYPRGKRAVRDLLRRRLYLAQQRADFFCHIQLMNNQINNPVLGQLNKSNYKKKNLLELFPDPHMKKSISSNLSLIEHYDPVIRDLEIYILEHTRSLYRESLNILQSIHGIGDIISLTILYEIDTIERFKRVQDFVSYCRLIRCTHQSAGKSSLGSNKKIGNPYLKRAFSEAAVFTAKFNPNIKKYLEKLISKKGKPKAYGILSRKLGQAVFFMLKNKTVFDEKRFLTH